MDAFDVNTYRSTVLSRLLKEPGLADPDTGNLFLVCAVDPSASPADSLKRLDDVVAAWQKDRTHPRYKDTVAGLVKRREDYAAILGDTSRRAAARARIEGAQQVSDTAALAELDRNAAALIKRHKGIPRSKVETLASFAETDGMSRQVFQEWLSRQPIVEDGTGNSVAAWDRTVRQQIRRQLDQLAQTDPENAPRYRTLLTFLGVNAKATPAQIRAAHTRLSEHNRSRVRGREMTMTEDLLSHVATKLMVDGGVDGYLASLRADARDSLRDDFRRRSLLTGSLPATEVDALTASLVALNWGFTAAEARDIVREAAHDARLSVEVGKEIDLIVCPDCRRPQAAGRKQRCQYCRAELYQDCPSCQTRIMAASEVCEHCGANLTVWRKADQVGESVQTLLSLGQPASAFALCKEVLRDIDVSTAPWSVRGAADSAQSVIHRARERWEDLHTAREDGHLWAAAVSATWLTRNASDVPDPDAEESAAAPEAEQVLAAIEQEKATVLQQVAKVRALPDDDREAALSELVARYPDCPEAAAMLAALPLPSPMAVTADRGAGGMLISWVPALGRRSTSVKYRLERQVTWPAAHVHHSVVGTTSSTHLEDASAPVAALVSYSVTAVEGSRASAPASVPAPVFIEGDVPALRAEVTGTDAVLTWPAAGLQAADIVIERDVSLEAGITAPTRRIRPSQPGRHVDGPLQAGVPYTYHAYLTYRTPDGPPVRTSGVTASVIVHAPPKAVTDIWARTDDNRATLVTFVSPHAGVVRVYAAPDEGALHALDHLDGTSSVRQLETAAVPLRLVGEGRRRVVDQAANGSVWYRPVTISGDKVAVGAILGHQAVRPVSGLRVAEDSGARVTITFEMPHGITESFVAWRRDRFPASATEPVSANVGGSRRLTNTKLQIEGGLTIDAPRDGRGLFVSVYPGTRTPAGALEAAPVASTLEARRPEALTVSYDVRFSGLIRKHLDLTVTAGAGQVLPPLRLVAAATEPDSPAVATTLCSYPGGLAQTTLRVEAENLPQAPFVIRLFAEPPAGTVVEVSDPALWTRTQRA